jgi:hypothetical protein
MADQPLSGSPLREVQKILTLLGCNSLMVHEVDVQIGFFCRDQVEGCFYCGGGLIA